MIKVYPFILKEKSQLKIQKNQEDLATTLCTPSVTTINNILLYSKNLELKVSVYIDCVEIIKS